MQGPLDDILPDGFTIDNMTERELLLVQWFLEDQQAVLDGKIEEIEQMMEDETDNIQHSYITADNEICVPNAVLRRVGYEPGDEFEHELFEGDIFLTLKKKEWDKPEWLDED